VDKLQKQKIKTTTHIEAPYLPRLAFESIW